MKSLVRIVLIVLLAKSSFLLFASDSTDQYVKQAGKHDIAYKNLVNAKELMLLNCTLITQNSNKNTETILANHSQLTNCLSRSIQLFEEVVSSLKNLEYSNAAQQTNLRKVIGRYEQAIEDITLIKDNTERKGDYSLTSGQYYTICMEQLDSVLDIVNGAKAKLYFIRKQVQRIVKN
jgi:predicted DNA-binding protein